MNKNLDLMDELLSVLTQTEEWENRQGTDPQIKAAEKELEVALKNVSHFVPREVYKPLEDGAIMSVVNAYAEAGILYGIQVADAIHAAAANPNALSQHILNRVAAQKAASCGGHGDE